MLPQQTRDDLLSFFSLTQDSDKAGQTIEQFEDLALHILIDTVLEQLDKEKSNQFVLLLIDPKKSEETITFAKQHIPELEQIVQKKLEQEIKSIAAYI